MEELLLQMFEAAKQDKKSFLALKNAAIECQQFELCSELRELEKELFPQTEEVKQARKLAHDVYWLLQMVEVNIPENVCWLVAQALKKYFEKNGNFSPKDANALMATHKLLFEFE